MEPPKNSVILGQLIIKLINLIVKHLNRHVQAPKFTWPLNQQGHENEIGCKESTAVKCMVPGRYWSYQDDGFIRCINVQLLRCTPETTVILYINCYWKINYKERKQSSWACQVQGSVKYWKHPMMIYEIMMRYTIYCQITSPYSSCFPRWMMILAFL